MAISNGLHHEPAPLAETLQIHIIGAGMGGMGSALALAQEGFKNIHVWEAAGHIGEVGAGINITPNLARILERWGVLGIAQNEAVPLKGSSVHSKHNFLSFNQTLILSLSFESRLRD
jgi:2-polyprenyl-6-methoxyphenol hydroxylase-like FAD-dependent oxidoreductase